MMSKDHKGVIITTKDNLQNVIQNDEKEIIISGQLAESVRRSQRLRKAGMVTLFILAFGLFIIPFASLTIQSQIYSASAFNDLDDSQSVPSDSNRRQFKLTSAADDSNTQSSTNPINVVTEYTRKEIVSINLGLGLLVILSICSLLHKIIKKYDEILLKVDGKLEIHLVHK